MYKLYGIGIPHNKNEATENIADWQYASFYHKSQYDYGKHKLLGSSQTVEMCYETTIIAVGLQKYS